MASEIIERALYNGRYHLVHNPNARGRAPRYVVNGTDKPKGVTTILGATLNKDLMEWAVSCAMEVLQAKLPVITDADLKKAAVEYKTRRDAGAGAGTEAHALVEGYLKGTPYGGKTSPESLNAFQAFKTWFEEVKPQVVNVEEVIYSHSFKYAGTYDCTLQIADKTYLCDLKTTNSSRKAPQGVYAEYFIQLGAYAAAHEEQRVFEEGNGGSKLLPIDDLMVISAKKTGKLDIMTASDLGLSVKECGEMFKRVHNLYTFLMFVTKELGGK